jgi:hypothetical protein
MKCLINPWLIKQRKKMNAPVTFAKADMIIKLAGQAL